MGQLEKYGLYVLCLVIFLILGVTIWGGDSANVPRQQNPAVSIRANPMTGLGGNAEDGNAVRTRRDGGASNASSRAGDGNYIDSLLSPVAQPPVANSSRANSSRTSSRQPDNRPNGNAAGRETANRGGGNPGPAGNGGNTRTADAGDVQQGGDQGASATAVATPVEYTIQKGDILGQIASRQLGSTRHLPAILDLNPGLDPKRLQVGQKILLPARGATRSATRSPDALERAGAYRLYTISKGDNFERIARNELGARRRVKEILNLNASVDPNRLRIGQKIKLPLK